MKKKNNEKIYSIAAIVIIIDQLTKLLVSSKMSLRQTIEIIPNFFSLYYIKNSGAAFSILQNNTVVIIVLSLFFLYVINRFIIKEYKLSKIQIMGFGLVIGGIVGNLIDRLLYHKVIDFLSFQFGSYFFPVFNVADISIVVAVILLIIGIFQEDKKENKKIKDKLSKDVEVIKVEKTVKKKSTTKKNNSKKKK